MAGRDERALYVISVAAELAGVHPQTLRIYERRGLIRPARTTGRSRRYSERDIDQLRHIQELTAEGVGIEGVKRILELEARIAALESELARVQAEAVEAVRATHQQYRRDLVPVPRAQLVPRRRPR